MSRFVNKSIDKMKAVLKQEKVLIQHPVHPLEGIPNVEKRHADSFLTAKTPLWQSPQTLKVGA
jgi:hypothetical protein